MWNIFESCWLLLTIAGVAFVAASIIRQEKPEWGYKPLLIPLLLAALAFGLDYGVTTDYEAVKGILPACIRAAVDRNADAIMDLVSENYSDSAHRNKRALRIAIESVLPRAAVNRVRIQSNVITMEENSAKSEFQVVVHLNQESQYPGAGSLMFVGMAFEYEKIGKQWFIGRMEVTSVNNQPWNWGSGY